MELQTILIDLEIIKQLKENDKLGLIIGEGFKKLFVQSQRFYSGISRWYYRYNRENTIDYLENLQVKIENATKFIIDGKHTQENNILKQTLSESITGFTTLKSTYNDDSITVARLTLIINKLNNNLKDLGEEPGKNSTIE